MYKICKKIGDAVKVASCEREQLEDMKGAGWQLGEEYVEPKAEAAPAPATVKAAKKADA